MPAGYQTPHILSNRFGNEHSEGLIAQRLERRRPKTGLVTTSGGHLTINDQQDWRGVRRRCHPYRRETSSPHRVRARNDEIYSWKLVRMILWRGMLYTTILINRPGT